MIVYGGSSERMAEISDGEVRCCVTSPPYWGLRNYGTGRWVGGDPACEHEGDGRWYTAKAAPSESKRETFAQAGPDYAARLRAGRWREAGSCVRCGAAFEDPQIGLERTVGEYVDRLVAVFREVRRCLADDGTLWLNMGDAYVTNRRGEGHADSSTLRNPERQEGIARGGQRRVDGLKYKDLIGLPWRVAFALQADGWWLRRDIVWSKDNCMPESAEDRPSSSHEYLFLLAKSERYYYDGDAIREPLRSGPSDRRKMELGQERIGGGTFDRSDPKLKAGASTNVGRRRGVGGRLLNGLQPPDPGDTGWAERGSRNARSVWEMATLAMPMRFYECGGGHVFPARRSLARGFPCTRCGQPSRRVDHTAAFPIDLPLRCIRAGSAPGDLVLDPFAGTGTTLEAAEALGRRAVGYEVNPLYRRIAEARCAQPGLFS